MDAFALPLMAAVIVALISATTYLTARDHAREKKQEREEAEAAGRSHGAPRPVRVFREKWWRRLWPF